ncbi:hypothetical protein [Microlunatus antarcticus]|uniref:Swt1-like HEPN domain-containing protein n=1 Tax=Microlunatus antarcticus TaxID=53388 RepID=A0A7W5P8D6_9ACTN|nr:hypothetical protein [Microlunatus antarcticus]MBB3328463.1 hypothetical protein [Microlunatus antarcticus]
MAHLDTGTALQACETALRDLMAHAYSKTYGAGWLEKVAGAEKIATWADRATEEVKTRGARGVVEVPNIGLAYANLYDLVAFADRHWEPLAEALGKKADVLPLLRRAERLRNPVGHSRSLLPFEEDLLSGIAGQIRNQVTIHMSSEAPTGEIYPRIEKVTDSFGRRSGSAIADSQMPTGAVNNSVIVLRPGEVVTFTCVGSDPQGRDLLWRFGGSAGGQDSIVAPSGTEAQLTWTVQDKDINENVGVAVYLEAHEAKYHRFGSFDHKLFFAFRVRPPGH